MKRITTWVLMGMLAAFMISCQSSEDSDNQPRKIEVLFLGHDSEHHNSEAYAPILASALADDGINFTYTEDPADLNDENLAKFDALLLYANHDSIGTSQEQALLDFVANGNGFIPIHSASYCFRNSEAFVELVGAQFQSHETGTFTASIVNQDHPVTDSLEEFETWDETYVHTMHNQDRTVLMERDGEPWTWVRTHGDGKVFYTAYGHDERTWENPGFHELVKAGIVWSVSDQVQENWEQFASTLPELTYEDRENIPNYEERDPAPRYQLPLSPEESQKFIQVPPGYEVELFASEPEIVNPIDMTWDEKGRLWVIETVDYPNTVREEDGVGDDKIKILEDTNNDGQADKVTVFADSLNIPTSLVFANGGVIVAQAPHFLFLQDTDGDDRADVRRKIISGWGTRDTHAGPSNLMYGFDNQIWGVVGYSGFEGAVGGDSLDFAEDIYRFNTDFDNMTLESMTNTSNNTWGLGFSETFDVFASTANNTHAAYMGIPMRYYENYEWPEEQQQNRGGRRSPIMAEKIDGHYAMHPITRNYRQVDVFGGFTAASGFQLYTARQFPQEYWNRMAFISEPTGGLVHQGIIEPDGASFTETDAWNIFASHDEWTSPVAAKVGPDGSLWVLDWYNFIIQHNPTPSEERGGYDAEEGEGNAYVNPLRDRSHGRIYRITYEENGPSEPMTLSQDNPDQLVEALGNDNMFWRLTAQRLLVERGETDVLPDLYELVQNEEVDDMGLNSAALHALWTIHGLGALDGNNAEALDVAIGALEHPASGVRKSAVKALPQTPETNQAILDSGVLNDDDAQTQLWAVLSTIEMPTSPEIGEALYELSQDSSFVNDEQLAEALKLSADVHQEAYRQASTAGQTGSSSSSSSSSESEGTTGTVKTEGDVQTIRIQAVMNKLAFDVTNFTVEAGKKVEIIFENPDFMQHNLLIVEPGALEDVGEAAEDLARSMEGPEQDYIPQMEEILFSTPLLSPEQTYTLSFTAPENPGDYPYVCTFPGHWRSMQGVMTVAENAQTANL